MKYAATFAGVLLLAAASPAGWHAATATTDLAWLAGAWFKAGEPGVELAFAETRPDGLTVAVVLPPKPGRPDVLTDSSAFRVTAPGKMVVLRGDSAADVRFTVNKTTLTIEGEFPAVPGDDRRLKFSGTYHRR
ncbi:MAG: hypothetical protein ACRC7O_06695 [Fimbriiglobus sp.]